MKMKRLVFLALSALLSVGSAFALNTGIKSIETDVKSEFRKDTQKQLVLTQANEFSTDNSFYGHSSHRSHSSHSSHRSHSSHYSSR
ncbi:hypothetical protein AGMMS49574_00790 [Bacteroidia bacterium]|nr:hypothetical protein AGMMS49574_00790 [Bacteroidia bacterium]